MQVEVLYVLSTSGSARRVVLSHNFWTRDLCTQFWIVTWGVTFQMTMLMSNEKELEKPLYWSGYAEQMKTTSKHTRPFTKSKMSQVAYYPLYIHSHKIYSFFIFYYKTIKNDHATHMKSWLVILMPNPIVQNTESLMISCIYRNIFSSLHFIRFTRDIFGNAATKYLVILFCS